MTFEEKLDRAKIGSKAAYESMCLSFIDNLYAAALIALKNENAARNSVITAIKDGYAGISRIKDEKHLRSWLVHELTKNIVDKLKEFKAEGVSYNASGVFAETDKLPDVERLVFAVSASFGYGTREISVLTGMSENAVSDKLDSARTHLAGEHAKISAAASDFSAPESLKERYRGFDESVARLERTAVIDDAQPEPEQKEEPEPEPEPETQHETKPEPEQPAEPEHETEPEKEQAAEPQTNDAEEEEAVFVEETEDGDEADEDDSVFEDEDYTEPESTAKDAAESDIGESRLDAETFIAVVSAEKMKGSEFLRLIGNTRISNSVYREIEQNPRLTKKRLITLLEQSPLTENDYYKLLMAVKDRREVLDAKEENRIALEKAGLYDGSRREKYRRRRREPPKTELQMAIGINTPKPSVPLTFEQGNSFTDTSYELQNAEGTFSQSNIRNDLAEREVKGADHDLDEIISVASRPKDSGDPLSHTAMQELFSDRDDEPVDPFAAIAANETGKQAKPSRIDKQENEWIRNAKAHLDERAESEKDNSSETIEFSATIPSASDTKTFDKLIPLPFEDEKQEKEEEPELTASEPAPGKSEETPRREKKPLPDISVTQIISDYAIGQSSFDDDEDILSEAEEPVGFSPDVGLVFNNDSGKGKEGSGLELSLGDGRKPASRTQTAPEAVTPDVDDDITEDVDEPDDIDGTEYAEEADAAEPAAAIEPEIPEIPAADDDEDDETGEDESDDDDGDDGEGSFDVAPARKKYKGNEYFHDDDKYYDGVNRGKIIACAVCAALLIAGSVGMKLSGGKAPETAEPADTAPAQTVSDTVTEAVTDAPETAPAETEFTENATLTKLSSYDDMRASRYSGAKRAEPQNAAAGYLRASSEPYSPELITSTDSSVIRNGSTAFIYADGTFRAVRLTDTEESLPAPMKIDPTRLYGYTVVNGELYVITKSYDDSTGKELHETRITVYGDDLAEKSTYTISGEFAGAGTVNGSFVAAAIYDPDTAASDKPYVSADGETSYIAASDIYAIDGAKHNAVTVLYKVGGKAAAVLGGYSDGFSDRSSVQFTDEGMTLVAADEGVTYAVTVTPDMNVTGVRGLRGEAFSSYCLRDGALIGQLPGSSGISAYKNDNFISTGVEGNAEYKETASAIAWSENGTAFVVSERGDGSKLLYGFDMSGDSPAPANVTADYIYTDKLSAAGGYLAGVKAEPTPDGERAGLRLSLYSYDNALKEEAYSIIELDSETPRENLKYLSSPAEHDSGFIASDETGTLFAVPTVYFDGFSEVERVVILRFDGTTFSQIGEHIMYDEKSSVLYPTFVDGSLYIITDTKITSLDTF